MKVLIPLNVSLCNVIVNTMHLQGQEMYSFHENNKHVQIEERQLLIIGGRNLFKFDVMFISGVLKIGKQYLREKIIISID